MTMASPPSSGASVQLSSGSSTRTGGAGGGGAPSCMGARQMASMMHSSGSFPLGRKRNQMAMGPKAGVGMRLGKRLK